MLMEFTGFLRGPCSMDFLPPRSMMRHQTRAHQPPIPRDMPALRDMCLDPRWFRFHRDGRKYFLRNHFSTWNGMCHTEIARLSEMMTWEGWHCQVDATFRCNPKILDRQQVFTIHAVKEHGDQIIKLSHAMFV